MWHRFQAGGWAIFVLLLWLGLSLGFALWLARWFRVLWRRRAELKLPARVVAVSLFGSMLFGTVGAVLGLVKAFGAVSGEVADPSQMARTLAEGISQAMNCTAFIVVFGVPGALVLAFLTRKSQSSS
jgi:hypothetical protein